MSESDKPTTIFHSTVSGTAITGHHDVISRQHMIKCRCDSLAMKGNLKGCRQGPYVSNSHIIYWNNQSTFQSTQVSQAGFTDLRMTSSSGGGHIDCMHISQSKQLEPG